MEPTIHHIQHYITDTPQLTLHHWYNTINITSLIQHN